jgi:uncharacterized protein
LKFTRDLTTSISIRNVTGESIGVGEDNYRSTVAVTYERVLGEWAVPAVSELTETDFAELMEAEIDLILLGTGSDNVFPPRDLVFAMARRGIGFEIMDTPAAARTFNLLAADGRRVAAVLYL